MKRMRRQVSVVIVVLLLSGCTVTRRVTDDHGRYAITQANEELQGRQATLLFRTGEQTQAIEVRLDEETISWLSVDENPHTRPISEIKQIYYIRPGRGLYVGGGVGAALGLAILLSNSDNNEASYGAPPKSLAVAGLGLTGLLLGALAEGGRKYVVYEH